MPVHHTLREGILVIAVDGDYTSSELRRVGDAGLRSHGTAVPVPVLLDMSGAAGLNRRTPADVRDTARFFAARASLMTRMAILAPDDLAFGLVRVAMAHVEGEGLDTMAFRARTEAVAWLNEP